MIDYCYDDAGNIVSCSNIEIGSQWYDAIDDWSQTGETSSISDFFDTHLSTYLDPIDISTNQFVDAYGQYITNLVPDWGSFTRFERIKDLSNTQFLGDYQDQVESLYTQQGRQGFGGTGAGMLAQEDFWRDYSDKARRSAVEQLQGEESIYSAWGSDFYNSLESIAEEAFVEASGYSDDPSGYMDCVNDCTPGDELCLQDCFGQI
tara:strand:+ start:834 stop:1448 length:615 start_codon:yes stop_codon:yes gene_type:complete